MDYSNNGQFETSTNQLNCLVNMQLSGLSKYQDVNCIAELVSSLIDVLRSFLMHD